MLHDQLLAADFAYSNRHFDAILVLLNANAMFPCGLNVDDCPDDVRAFAEMSQKFHSNITSGNAEEIDQTLTQNPNLRHFYNLNNESASAAAITTRQFAIYELLMSRNLYLSVWEEMDELIIGMDGDDLRELREIHFRNKKDMQEQHLTVLMSKSFVGHDVFDVQDKLDRVMRAFRVLNGFAVIQILLKIAALLTDLHVVFDFNRDSVQYLDPTQDRRTLGLFYGNGRIYVGARQLLDPQTEHEVFATIAHELCHFVLYHVFGRSANPYDDHDEATAAEFEQVSRDCEAKKQLDKIIGFVYSCYDQDQQHAELIVRVPHFYAHYCHKPEIVEAARREFASLFGFYESKVMPRLENALVELKAKAADEKTAKDRKISLLIRISIFLFVFLSSAAVLVGFIVYEPTYSWHELNHEQKMTVLDGSVRFEGIDTRFSDLYGRNESSSVFGLLNSQQIKTLLKGNVLDLSEARNEFLEHEIFLTHRNLTEKLREKVAAAVVEYQGEKVRVTSLLLNDTADFLNSLDSRQIFELIKNYSTIEIGHTLTNDIDFYVDRRFIDKTKNYDDRNWFDNLTIYRDIYSDEQKRSFSLTSESLIGEVEKEQFVLLSDDAGTGKSTTFRNLALELRQKFPLKWIEYVDLKAHTAAYDKLKGSGSTVLRRLTEIFGLKSPSLEVFTRLFSSDNVIILWDGFDEISPTYSAFMLDLMSAIRNETQNLQLLATRPQYDGTINGVFHTTIYKLLPYLEAENEEFLNKFYALKNFTATQVRAGKENVKKLALRLQAERFENWANKTHIESPLLLSMIAELSSNLGDSLYLTNLYTIYGSFVRTKVKIASTKGVVVRGDQESLLTERTFNLREVFQYFAIKLLYFGLYAQLKIRRTHDDVRFDTNELSRFGILIFDATGAASFVHRTFAEFFVAQFFVDNVYCMRDDPRDEEIELRLIIMTDRLTRLRVDKVNEFLNGYLDTGKPATVNGDVERIFLAKLRDVFYKLVRPHVNEGSAPAFVADLLHFFDFRRRTLEAMWDMKEKKTFFSWWAVEKPMEFVEHFERLRELVVGQFGNDSEKVEQLLFGTDQRGNFLYGALRKLEKAGNVTKSKFPMQKFVKVMKIGLDLGSREWQLLGNFSLLYDAIKDQLTGEEVRQMLATNVVEILAEQGAPFWGEYSTRFTHHETQELIYAKSRKNLTILSEVTDFELIKIFFKSIEGTPNSRFFGLIYSDSKFLQFDIDGVLSGDNFDVVWSEIKNRSAGGERKRFLTASLRNKNFVYVFNCLTAAIEHGTAEKFERIRRVYVDFFSEAEMGKFYLDFLGKWRDPYNYRWKPQVETMKAYTELLRPLLADEENRKSMRYTLRRLYALYGDPKPPNFNETNFPLFALMKEILTPEELAKIKEATTQSIGGRFMQHQLDYYIKRD
jgi:predicted SprT family Zn-dependent metalloprotease